MKSILKFEIIFVLLIALLLSSTLVYADDGTLTKDTIERIQSSFQMDPHNRAVYNAITNNSVKDLALNRDIIKQHDNLYSHKIKVKGITNQKSSGRCWLFAGLNNVRYFVIKDHELPKFEFSQIYLTFWDKLEKANTFLEHIIALRDRGLDDRELEFVLKHPCDDGGFWESVVNLINKYGVIPKDVYPETNSSNSTGTMNRILYAKLRANAVILRDMHQQGKTIDQLRIEKEKMLAEIYRILAINLGEPPTEFTWRYEDKKKDKKDEDSEENKDKDSDQDQDESEEVDEDTDQDQQADEDKDAEEDKDDEDDDNDIQVLKTTPQAFWKEFVGVDLSEYVNLFNDTIHDHGKHYQISYSKNLYDGSDINYVNIDIETLKEIAKKSLLDNTPVMFACDVSYDQNSDKGIMALNLYDYESIYGIDISMTKAQRALYRGSVRNHGMLFTGIDIQDEKTVKWRVENSWGSDKGDGGYWAMYDLWFDEHVYNIIVNKKYVSEDVLKMFELPPVILPPWDPMM